jgi:hypothetical protein
VLSVHDTDHDACTVLAGSPMWTGAVGLDPDRLADSFRAAARLAVDAPPEARDTARRLAANYARAAQIAPAVRRLVDAPTRHETPPQPRTAGRSGVPA